MTTATEQPTSAMVHQPYFFPWLGFFAKLARVKKYVVLDSVQFRKRHYLDRCRIVNMHGEIAWLSLPVGEHHGDRISDVRISEAHNRYPDRIFKTIEHSYARAQNFSSEWPELRASIEPALRQCRHLVSLNIHLITALVAFLDLPRPLYEMASEIDTDAEDATVRLIRLLTHEHCSSILIGSGAGEHVHDWDRLLANGIRPHRLDYLSNHPIYRQTRRSRVGFSPGLSVLDAILNVGRARTRELITSPDLLITPVGTHSASGVGRKSAAVSNRKEEGRETTQ